MLTWREVGSYLRLLWRWSPVLLVAVLLSAGTAWYLTEDTPDYYVAQSSMMVGNNFTTNTPSDSAVDMSNMLANFYAVLAHREVIMGPVIDRLGLEIPWQYVAHIMLTTNVNPNANLLELSITDSDPERAAALANALADQLIAYSPNSPEKVEAERQEIERQISETQLLLTDLDQKVKDLEAKQSSLSSALDLRDVADQLEKLQLSRDRYQSTYNELLLLRGSSTANSLSIFERAKVPDTPLPQRRLLVLGIAALGGLVLAIAAVLVLDFLDTRWRPGRDLEGRIGLANLGRVRYEARPRFGGKSQDALARQRDVREIYANMVLQARSSVPQTVLVSSPQPSEPRSAFAIDLAGVYAQSGLRVLLVDAELAKPHVTRLLLAEGDAGHAQTPSPDDSALKLWSGSKDHARELPPELWVRLRQTPLGNVILLPSHHVNPEALPVLVPSLHWPELVQGLRQAADIIIFDGPSLLTGADSALLAPLMDGVVLALNPATDSRSDIASSKKRLLNNEGTRLLGAVTVEQANGRTQSRRAGSRKEPRSPRRGEFSISIDSGGITLKLPEWRRGAEPEETQQPAQAPEPDSGGHTVGAAQPVRERSGQERTSEVVPTWEELRARSVGGTEYRASARHDQVIVPPPPAPVIVTPPPLSPLITPEFTAGVAEASSTETPAVELAQAEQAKAPAKPRRKRAAAEPGSDAPKQETRRSRKPKPAPDADPS